MSTEQSSITKALFGKVRSTLLALFSGHSDESFYFREIVRFTGLGQGALQRELAHLVTHGLVIRRKEGNQVYYQANIDSPIFYEIKSLMTKTCGLAGLIRDALLPVQHRIAVAFIFGSFAKGTETADSDVDVLVIGDATLAEMVDLLGAVQESIGREINPSVYPVDEFVTKALAGQHFVTSIIGEPKIFLIGDEDEFARLVEKRLAG